MYDNENKTIDTTWNLKWKTSTEDWLVETLSLIRKQKKPTQETSNMLWQKPHNQLKDLCPETS